MHSAPRSTTYNVVERVDRQPGSDWHWQIPPKQGSLSASTVALMFAVPSNQCHNYDHCCRSISLVACVSCGVRHHIVNAADQVARLLEEKHSSRTIGESPCSAMFRTTTTPRSSDETRSSRMGSTLRWRRQGKGWPSWRGASTKQRQVQVEWPRIRRDSWSGSCVLTDCPHVQV